MQPEQVPIEQLLPQRPPFVTVDRLTEFSQEKAVTVTAVRADSMFVKDGCLTPEGLIENIAQTCAAKIGYYNKFILKKDVQIGVIGAIRNMIFRRCPNVGEVLTTTVETLEEIFGMTMVRGYVCVGSETVVECTMKIAISNSPQTDEK